MGKFTISTGAGFLPSTVVHDKKDVVSSSILETHPWLEPPPDLCLRGAIRIDICAMVKSRYIGDGRPPTFNRNPYGYINPYYWVDDHPLLYGNNGSLDPGTYMLQGKKHRKTLPPR